MSQAEGYIKFNQEFHIGPPPAAELIAAINGARTRLFDLGLIGMDEGGIGFGNVSIRSPEGEPGVFIVSGTATGNKRILETEDYALVLDYDIAGNSLLSSGRRQASSESLSHGAAYAGSGDVATVIHVHSRLLFEGMIRESYPQTSPAAEYGTPEIAADIRDAVAGAGDAAGALVMLGHQNGIIAYGSSVEEAESILTSLHARFTR